MKEKKRWVGRTDTYGEDGQLISSTFRERESFRQKLSWCVHYVSDSLMFMVMVLTIALMIGYLGYYLYLVVLAIMRQV